MTVALDPPVVIGTTVVAALARTDLLRSGPSCFGAKRAVAILIQRDGEMVALAPAGSTLSDEDVEALCPGALARFGALCAVALA